MALLDTDTPWARDYLYECDGEGCARRVRVLTRSKGKRKLPHGWVNEGGGRTLCGACAPLAVTPPTAREAELEGALEEISLAHATALRQRDEAQAALRTCAQMARLCPGSELPDGVLAEALRVLGDDQNDDLGRPPGPPSPPGPVPPRVG